MKLYFIRSILSGPGIFITLPYLFFRYHTLRYRFDAEGIHARWGILFREEVNLAYARIQDIHLTSGFIQRWLKLADVQVQTASGSATPELIIEGFKEFEAIRDYLYTRMRGYQKGGGVAKADARADADDAAPLLQALREVRDEMRATREAMERIAGGPPRPAEPAPAPAGNNPRTARPRHQTRPVYRAFARFVERFLRIPPRPDPPPGSGEATHIFRAAPQFYKYRLALWALKHVPPGLALVVVFTVIVVLTASNSGETGAVIAVLGVVVVGTFACWRPSTTPAFGSTTKTAGMSSPTAASASAREWSMSVR